MPEILSIGELLDLGNSAATAGLIPYSALEYNGSGDISGISGSAIAGGVDSAVVSSIVSSYVESGVSGKVDQTAFDDCCSSVQSALSGKLDASSSGQFAPSGDYYSASNPSGFITSGDLSSKLDASASSQFAPSGNYVYESSYSSFSGDVVNNISSMSSIVSGLTGDYLEKSASSMFAPSGDYALSSDVSSTVDVVANNSASWGQGGGDYSGISPVIVDNDERTIDVSSMPLDVDDTMTSYVSGGVTYFGVNESALNISSKLDASASSLFQPSGVYVYESSYSSFSGDVVNNISSMSSVVSGLTGEYIEKSASSMFQESGDYYSATNPSGFITGVDLSNYQTIDGMSAYQVSGDYAYNSSLSSYALSSSLSSYALSADVSGVIDTVSSNSGSWAGGGGAGDYVEKSATAVNIGSANIDSGCALVQGVQDSAYYNSFAQGWSCHASASSLAQGVQCVAQLKSFAQGWRSQAHQNCLSQGNACSSHTDSFSQGESNSAYLAAFAQGSNNKAYSYSLAQGARNSAYLYSVVFGQYSLASGYAYAHGYDVSAINFAFADGSYLTAQNSAWVIGHRNLHGDGDTTSGDSAAFVIGDGVDHLTGRHDLMLVTRDGEITMYSSTADTTGIKLVNTLRALSAWATANGWTGA